MTDEALEANPFAEIAEENEEANGEEQDVQHVESSPTSHRLRSAESSFSNFCCQIGSIIRTGNEQILITSAQKSSESSGSSFITYTIHFNEQEVKRRYSEFESLRKSLSKLCPTFIVPPIPEKHSFTDYATMQSKAKEDAAIIEKRKRMLQTFLNRVAKHPQLQREHIFHRFLEDGVPWNEVLHSPPLSTLPKNILQISPTNLSSQSSGSPTTTSISSISLPNPNPSQQLKHPDPRFVECENFTNRFANHMSQNLEKTNRRFLKRLSDLSKDYSELGAIYNGFSLSESGELANAIEKVGQAVDSSYVATENLIAVLESDFSEPLQEYSQFAQIIKQVLHYRHMKHLQLELAEETLEKQKVALEGLNRSEEEAKRLEVALNRERMISEESMPPQPRGSFDSEDGSAPSYESHDDDDFPNGEAGLASSQRRHNKRGGSKLLSVLSHTIHGIMDVDPESNRRNSIGKTTDSVLQLEEALEISKKDLKNISISIQDDLNRFQRQKICDLRDMLVSYAKTQLDWCKKNLSSWEEAKAEIEKVQS